MEGHTKQRILDAALGLFSQKGFYGTSMNDIASVLEITKAALYRHFSGKEEILDVILDKGEEYYDNIFGSIEHPPKIPDSTDELRQLSLNQINFTMHDPDIVKYRRLFTIEQFYSDRMAELATKHFISGIEELYSYIFKEMMDKGLISECDPGFLAYEYVSPITVMIHLCDRQPEKESDAMERIRQHIDNFINIYGH